MVPGQCIRLLKRITMGVITLIVILICIVLGWNLLTQTWNPPVLPVWMILSSLLILHALLVFLLEKSLAQFFSGRAWRYRFSFLISFLLVIVVCFVALILKIWGVGINFVWGQALTWLTLSWLGSFIGGLVATASRETLWEDNAPPADDIQQAVVDMHSDSSRRLRHSPPSKRLFDISLALLGLLLSSPIWLISSFLVWFEDPGGLLFVKNSVGLGGVNFRQFKLRTMVRGAEESTGPVMAQEDDARVLRSGRLLRRSHLDELPQLLNVLRGEMSVVGPRPQRTVLVYGYLLDNPGYAERHRVLPGLAGLAQVSGSYYITPRQKLRLDRLYIQRMSLALDIRLLFAAFLIAFWYRWKKGWDGQLPRWVLHKKPVKQYN